MDLLVVDTWSDRQIGQMGFVGASTRSAGETGFMATLDRLRGSFMRGSRRIRQLSQSQRVGIVVAGLAARAPPFRTRDRLQHPAAARMARRAGVPLDDFTGASANVVSRGARRALSRQAEQVLETLEERRRRCRRARVMGTSDGQAAATEIQRDAQPRG